MMTTRILLTGINGQVGRAVQAQLAGTELFALSREQLDLTSPSHIREVVQQIKPTLIINPAAYTAVDKAESEDTMAFAINAEAPRILAEEASKIGAAFIHFSTDYVYDGSKQSPYLETDEVKPISVYGKSKLAGEQAIQAVGAPHLILRTSWVYSNQGKNFLSTILRLASERESLRVVADQSGTPTSALSIANALSQLIQAWDVNSESQSGIYHFTNQGFTTWHAFACQILREYVALPNGKISLKASPERIEAITSADYPTPAKRPYNSRLDNAKLKSTFGITLPNWDVALKEVMERLVL